MKKQHNQLHWSHGNVKLPTRIIHLSLPSGHSCPSALKCLSKADQDSGKITDGRETHYRCYAATMEARHPAIRKQRWQNFLKLNKKSKKDMFKLLLSSLKRHRDNYLKNHNQHPIIRAHIGGDFFNKSYFLSWMELAKAYAPTWFYAYTKRLDLWTDNMDLIPPNFELNASRGGKHDNLIDTYNLKSAEVVYSYDEAKQKGLEIDHDDSHAYTRGPSFAQLIHGTQPKGSEASKALTLLKLQGWTGYNTDSKAVS
tara:strand:- start:1687 stop:2451 length:765 start_codon:yes stop_codon:yes gene_type:complete